MTFPTFLNFDFLNPVFPDLKKDKLFGDKCFAISISGLKLGILILCIFLSGCAGMRSKFDCNVASGGKCASMHNINRMANYGAFVDGSENSEKPFESRKLLLSKKMESKNENKNIQNIYGAPLRSNEKIQQIWIGPYEDSNGNYYEGNNIYVVVKKSQWTNI